MKGTWHNRLLDLTPVEPHGDMLFKREDRFAPLGYGGVNGSKLRQCIWMVSEHVRANPDTVGMVSGSSVKSPQISLGAAVAQHYGLQLVHVIGATGPRAAIRHENVRIGAALGARFVFTNVAYNPALQRRVESLLGPRLFKLDYGISVAGPMERIEAFHRIGSEQVRNIPDSVETLLMPAGSCNSCVSVLYGIARFRPKNLRRVVLFGIGPNRLAWIHARLGMLEHVSKRSIIPLFLRDYQDDRQLAYQHDGGADAPILLTHYDLHGRGFASYQDEMPYRLGDIEFHPTYEGKVMSFIERERLQFERPCFWIVGSKPYADAMRLPPRPDRAPEWDGAW